MTIDIPGAFMHVDIDELIHVRLEGQMAKLLARVDPEKYRTYMSKENGKEVLYVELQKALYGTLQAALLFWENLTEFLTQELGFEANLYDSCIVNKIINGKQCTIIWHVDDLKLSHVEQQVLEDIADKLNAKYGKQTPLVIHRGKIHDYLGMTIDYSEDRKVKFSMPDYVEGILDDAPSKMDGVAMTPAGPNLFTVKKDDVILDDDNADTFHRLMAKMLYLFKRARPDLQPTVAYLMTRVIQPNVDDWKKLT
jgi:Reverse transcriptase (RNA-dependent DNA polymerase)